MPVLPRACLAILLPLLITACASQVTRKADAPLALPAMDSPSAVLFWAPAEREAGFRAMDRITPHRTIPAGGTVHPLPTGEPLAIDVDGFMQAHRSAGLLVLQDGRIRLERYALGFGPEGRWTSFSMAKSLTSTLVGAAIHDGHIESLETPITRYLPELAGSGYDGVTVRQLLTMTSGVAWNEDYEDPQSDVARFFSAREIPAGMDPTLAYMRELKREAEPGTRWHYSTGETNLVGLLVARATGRPLADYLSAVVWQPYGMEQDGAWMIDESGQEAAGCCIMAGLRDWGRVGQFVLEDGIAGGVRRVPEGWFAEATTKQADIGDPGRGYGFQWWTRDDGSFDAYGIFGQTIHIDPTRRLVVVILSAWPQATSSEESRARNALIDQIRAAADSGAGRHERASLAVAPGQPVYSRAPPE